MDRGMKMLSSPDIQAILVSLQAASLGTILGLPLAIGIAWVLVRSSFKGKVPVDYLLGTWWNHSIVKAPAQISAVSGRIIKQKVIFLGKETITLGSNTYNALHYNFSSTDKKLDKNKRLNTDVWYDEKTLNWIKATFEKKGKWEYKLVLIN